MTKIRIKNPVPMQRSEQALLETVQRRNRELNIKPWMKVINTSEGQFLTHKIDVKV